MLTLLMALAAATPASTDFFASLKPGEWQYHRVIPDPQNPGKTQAIDVTECEDPAEAQKKQRAMLEKHGCKFGEAKRVGDTVTTVIECDTKGAKAKITNVSVLTKDGYQSTIDTEGDQGGKTVRQRETLTAKRLGDCKK